MDTFGRFGSSVYSDDYFKPSLSVFWGGSVEPPKKCSAFCSDECLVIHCWKTLKSKGMNFFPYFDQKILQSTKDSNWHIFSCIWHIYTERHIVFVSINVLKSSEAEWCKRHQDFPISIFFSFISIHQLWEALCQNKALSTCLYGHNIYFFSLFSFFFFSKLYSNNDYSSCIFISSVWRNRKAIL